ncbi:nitrogen regulation protein NR(I) [Vibrio cincinnatiensis]|jgi:two-component system nitrogen regulation response regulator GlnG|uniref:DNA-binding transcriptional regulator NtrC n=1 Tax=Vibrio cincinnatiensis DSM 19608 TaxID=1123491 RepID=A0A1T4RTU7_VIBCI|nr:nitrogen regulation protein NR(I) [Vibrio cincinnatiensis]MCG3722683.1 nitrogen regulation protein NR(I) [Vibrio cincinnatiensis]MCG3732781.1 nitrogen regulation protein NR(I) [Vibrio cincinnatiensis]MCG3736405.1 nitrogen regulation protein NR(I) [Vibrio cincinnatiensis]MCG3740113.1 nitrogen regulation protein NR(I) [Vibrio cincinnatiensis]MCG3743615.1 nitrogen regulation protein NR(I) [Vibrio cincinnatiensis]
MSKGYVWVVDDDSSIRWVMEKTLSSANIKCETFTDAESVLMALERETPDVLISDIRMPGIDGIELLNQVHSRTPELPVIIMTAHSDLDAAVNAYQKGAFEYLAKPFDVDEAVALAERAIAHGQEQRKEQSKQQLPPYNSPEIIGEAPAMQEVFRAIGRLSRSSISVLINGESGTGKELVAHALHRHSPRAQKPFIALNMAAIPKDLIESELFGHEKGAFTGANSVRQGRFEQANGGTLFLDEIGDMPLDIQTRLLRVLADGQFYRVGGHSAIKVDVRIVAATHQHLEKLVHQGKFREDLFHRLNVIRIQIPALRERRQDIEKLTKHFLALAAKELGVEMKTLHPKSIEILNRLEWPGNVRQLENMCRWLTVMASGTEVLPSDFPPELLNERKPFETENVVSWKKQLESWAKTALEAGETELLTHAQPEFERILLEAALNHTNGHKQDAAKVLGWGRNTLTRKLKELY